MLQCNCSTHCCKIYLRNKFESFLEKVFSMKVKHTNCLTLLSPTVSKGKGAWGTLNRAILWTFFPIKLLLKYWRFSQSNLRQVFISINKHISVTLTIWKNTDMAILKQNLSFVDATLFQFSSNVYMRSISEGFFPLLQRGGGLSRKFYAQQEYHLPESPKSPEYFPTRGQLIRASSELGHRFLSRAYWIH